MWRKSTTNNTELPWPLTVRHYSTNKLHVYSLKSTSENHCSENSLLLHHQMKIKIAVKIAVLRSSLIKNSERFSKLRVFCLLSTAGKRLTVGKCCTQPHLDTNQNLVVIVGNDTSCPLGYMTCYQYWVDLLMVISTSVKAPLTLSAVTCGQSDRING